METMDTGHGAGAARFDAVRATIDAVLADLASFAAGRGKAKSLPDEAYSALPVRNPGGGCAAGVARNGSAPRQP
jgi:hypothetical protein